MTENEIKFLVNLFFDNKSLNVKNITICQNLNDGANTYFANIDMMGIEITINSCNMFSIIANVDDVCTINSILDIANYYIANYDINGDFFTQYTINKTTNGFDVHFSF